MVYRMLHGMADIITCTSPYSPAHPSTVCTSLVLSLRNSSAPGGQILVPTSARNLDTDHLMPVLTPPAILARILSTLSRPNPRRPRPITFRILQPAYLHPVLFPPLKYPRAHQTPPHPHMEIAPPRSIKQHILDYEPLAPGATIRVWVAHSMGSFL
jgi:hypothetical protein